MFTPDARTNYCCAQTVYIVFLVQGRGVWKKVCTYKLEPSEDRATSLNIALLSKDRHF